MLDHSPHATQCPLMPGHQVLSSSHSLPRPPLAIESHCADEQTNPPSQGLPTVTQPGTHTMCSVRSVSPLLTPVLCPQVKGLLRRQHTERGAEATITTPRRDQRPSGAVGHPTACVHIGSWPVIFLGPGKEHRSWEMISPLDTCGIIQALLALSARAGWHQVLHL